VVVVLKERRCSQYSGNNISDTKVTQEPLSSDFNDQRVKRIYTSLVEQVVVTSMFHIYTRHVATSYESWPVYSTKVKYSSTIFLENVPSYVLNV
jgi:hypothetical protein